MKNLLVAALIVSLAVLPALAGSGCTKAEADKKGCTPAQRLACGATDVKSEQAQQCEDITKKLEALKKMKGADSEEMKAVIEILESMLKCQKDSCAGKCAPASQCKESYKCPKCEGKTYMKPGKCVCGAELVKI